MEKVCCVFGHRTITYTKELENKIYETAQMLIESEDVTTFLFGSKSQFNDLCYDVITELKTEYPQIKRIYVRSAFPDISEDYKEYLLKHYEDTYFSEKMRRAGKASYVERNYEMIDKSDFCMTYYIENYGETEKKSGTKIAYNYAVKKKKVIINVQNPVI